MLGATMDNNLAAPPSFNDPWSASSDPFPHAQDTFNHAISPDFRDANVRRWNFNIQQQLGDDWILQVAYAGKNSHKLNDPREANMAAWRPGATDRNIQQLRQFLAQYCGSVSSLRADGDSTCNAMKLLLQKRFPMWAEGRTVELRGEFYDLLNRPNLGNPNANVRSPAFGRITRAGDSRVVQVALRYDV